MSGDGQTMLVARSDVRAFVDTLSVVLFMPVF